MASSVINNAKVFAAATSAAFGFFFGVVQAYDYFGFNMLDGMTIGAVRAILIAVTSLMIGSISLNLVALEALPFKNAIEQRSTFEDSLLETLTRALRNKNYAEVIRIGEALSRPLFESGSFAARLKIGRVVEEAAARSERKDKQVAALIDSIGWSLVELGRYDEANRSIQHGIELSDEIGNSFYKAKGYRHLGVIARRMKNYTEAEKYYHASMSLADKIAGDGEREIMIAGLNYALSSLYYFTGAFDKAEENIESAILIFTRINDEYRLNMSLVTKGDIQFKKGMVDKAKDTYRKVLRVADRNTEKLQVARSCLGLAEIYLTESRWGDVKEMVEILDGMDLKDFKAERDRKDAVVDKLPIKVMEKLPN